MNSTIGRALRAGVTTAATAAFAIAGLFAADDACARDSRWGGRSNAHPRSDYAKAYQAAAQRRQPAPNGQRTGDQPRAPAEAGPQAPCIAAATTAAPLPVKVVKTADGCQAG